MWSQLTIPTIHCNDFYQSFNIDRPITVTSLSGALTKYRDKLQYFIVIIDSLINPVCFLFPPPLSLSSPYLAFIINYCYSFFLFFSDDEDFTFPHLNIHTPLPAFRFSITVKVLIVSLKS